VKLVDRAHTPCPGASRTRLDRHAPRLAGRPRARGGGSAGSRDARPNALALGRPHRDQQSDAVGRGAAAPRRDAAAAGQLPPHRRQLSGHPDPSTDLDARTRQRRHLLRMHAPGQGARASLKGAASPPHLRHGLDAPHTAPPQVKGASRPRAAPLAASCDARTPTRRRCLPTRCQTCYTTAGPSAGDESQTEPVEQRARCG
jgi:hypothetical protein